MNKQFRYKEGNYEYIATIQINHVLGVNTSNIEGKFPVLKIRTYLKDINGRLLKSKDVLFPEVNSKNKAINYLLSIGNNYTYGTKSQYEILKKYGINNEEDVLKNIKKCIDILKENNLYSINGITFGNKILIANLPDEALNICNNI